jgi:serine/threonine protein kinase
MSPAYFQFSNDYGIPLPAVSAGVREEGFFFRRFRGLVYPWNKENSSIIGRGGSGVIHIVRDEIMDRVVALKLPNESILEEPQVRSEVLNEASQALELTHPNIVRIFDFHDQDGRWGISMQFVRGKSLDKWREKLAPYQMSGGAFYDVEQVAPWIQQLCDALSYAHEEVGIVHCDIKPPNLLLERWFDTRMRITREKLLLTDFGITQKLRDFTTRTQRHRGRASGGSGGSGSEEGGAAGTLAYMSPQQLAGKDGAVSDDIYAVGMTIYELLTGRPAFYQGDAKIIQHQIESVLPPPMMERRKERGVKSAQPIPDLWEQVTAQCLHKDPARRPASIRELARLLGLSSQSAGLSLEEQGRMRREADGLKNQVESQTVQITTLTHRVGELEEASSGKVEEAALIEARAQVEQLQASLNRRDAELREYDERLQDIEEEKTRLEHRLAEIDAATQNAASEGDQEKQLLQTRFQQAQDQARKLQAERDEAQNLHKQSEDALASLRAQQAADAKKAAEAAALAKSAESRVKQAEDKAEETRKRLEAAKKDEIEQIRKNAADTEAKARQSAAEAEKKARQEAAEAGAKAQKATEEAEKARQQLASLTDEKAAPLRPVFNALLALLVAGLIVGAILGKLLGGGGASENAAATTAAQLGSQIRSEKHVLILKRHIQAWLSGIQVPEAELGTHFAALPADAPATGLSWLEAAAFAEWLTTASGLDPSKEWLDLPALSDLPLSSSGAPAREWTRDEAEATAASVSRPMKVFVTGGQPSALPRSQKQDDTGFHLVLRAAP